MSCDGVTRVLVGYRLAAPGVDCEVRGAVVVAGSCAGGRSFAAAARTGAGYRGGDGPRRGLAGAARIPHLRRRAGGGPACRRAGAAWRYHRLVRRPSAGPAGAARRASAIPTGAGQWRAAPSAARRPDHRDRQHGLSVGAGGAGGSVAAPWTHPAGPAQVRHRHGRSGQTRGTAWPHHPALPHRVGLGSTGKPRRRGQNGLAVSFSGMIICAMPAKIR